MTFVICYHWQWLEVLQVTFGVIIEDDTGIEQAFGVEELLYGFHHFVGLVAPLVTNVGGHVATCAVFGLQGAVVLVYHQRLDVLHQCLVTVHFRLGREALIEDEVIVSL